MACPFQHCSCLVLSFLSEQADYPHLAAIPKKNNNRWAFIQKYFNTVQDLIIILQDRSWGLQHISFVKTTNVFSPKIANLHLLQEICIKIDNRSNTLSTFLEQITLFRHGFDWDPHLHDTSVLQGMTRADTIGITCYFCRASALACAVNTIRLQKWTYTTSLSRLVFFNVAQNKKNSQEISVLETLWRGDLSIDRKRLLTWLESYASMAC